MVNQLAAVTITLIICLTCAVFKLRDVLSRRHVKGAESPQTRTGRGAAPDRLPSPLYDWAEEKVR